MAKISKEDGTVIDSKGNVKDVTFFKSLITL